MTFMIWLVVIFSESNTCSSTNAVRFTNKCF